MAISSKKITEVCDILKNYNKTNPYILSIKKDVFVLQKPNAIGEFQIEYILNNYQKEILKVDKIVKLADWYAEKKKEEWNTEFLPNKVKIISLLGETSTIYHCLIQYRKSVEPSFAFLSKKGILTDFLTEDFHNLDIDFNKYDELSSNSIKYEETNKLHLLLPHQKEGIKFLISRKKCILADDQGLGKTSTLSVAALEGKFESILIICPASLKTNWRDELLWYANDKDITIIDSYIGKKKVELEKLLGYEENSSNKTLSDLQQEFKNKKGWIDNKFIILNYDILDKYYEIPTSRSKENISNALENSQLFQHIKNKKSLIIIDEAHNFSNSKSNRYKVVKNLIKYGNPDSIYLATGTPVTNDPSNLYCLLNLIGHSITNDWEYYMKHYCGGKEICAPKDREKRNTISAKYVAKHNKPTWAALSQDEKDELNEIIKKQCKIQLISTEPTNLEELKEKIKSVYLRRLKVDIKNFAIEKNRYELDFILNSEQQIEYNKLWDEYVKKKNENNELVNANKELLEGGIYRKYLALQMIPNTIDLVNEKINNGEKVIVACCFDDEIYSLKEYFKDSAVVFNGKLNTKEKDDAKNEFFNNDNVKVFLANIKSAGVGLTLINSHCIIFNSFSYSNTDNKQMEDRIYRVGQTQNCQIYYQLFVKTECENMWRICARKDETFNTIIKRNI